MLLIYTYRLTKKRNTFESELKGSSYLIRQHAILYKIRISWFSSLKKYGVDALSNEAAGTVPATVLCIYFFKEIKDASILRQRQTHLCTYIGSGDICHSLLLYICITLCTYSGFVTAFVLCACLSTHYTGKDISWTIIRRPLSISVANWSILSYTLVDTVRLRQCSTVRCIVNTLNSSYTSCIARVGQFFTIKFRAAYTNYQRRN